MPPTTDKSQSPNNALRPPAVLSRRAVLRSALLAACCRPASVRADDQTYATHAKGIRILPGHWRPHYPWEHIAWVSPAWPSQDYIWIDLPEAIFTRQGLLFLSHVNPRVQPVRFPNPPAVAWQKITGGIAYRRTLPNNVTFGAKVTAAPDAADLELFIHNESDKPLNDITLQTCFFLRAITEFSQYTADNKFVHLPDRGWTPFNQARNHKTETGRYRLGWRSGPKLADLPIMVTRSANADRLVACTWGTDTYSLVCNPHHPCMHADPAFPDLAPGQRAAIRGKLIFFQGSLDAFTHALRQNRFSLGPLPTPKN